MCKTFSLAFKEFSLVDHKYFFGKFREGSGGTYCINIQEVVEKMRIQRSKLSLQIGIDIDSLPDESAHNCEKCGYILDDDAFNVSENLPELGDCLPRNVKETLLHISGYITWNDIEEIEATKSYHLESGNYTDDLNRGGLKIPSDNVC